MARKRASEARAAFARVGTATVGEIPAGNEAGGDVSIPASGNASVSGDLKASEVADQTASDAAGVPAGVHAGGRAGRLAGEKAGRPRRRVGRPRGPERVALTTRILAATDERLTAAVEMTGQSPQYIVDTALEAYFDLLGVPGPRGRVGSVTSRTLASAPTGGPSSD